MKYPHRRKARREYLSRALRRQWMTGILLQRGSWTVAQLADTLCVSKATCQRDLDLLAGLFIVNIEKDPHHQQRSRYYMPVAFKPNLAFIPPRLKKKRPPKRLTISSRSAK